MVRQPLSDTEYRRFSEWLREDYGLFFGPEKKDILRAKLEPHRLALGFDTFEQMFFHLKYHPDRELEREKLIPHLTNNESYFLRESGQLDVLRDEVLPELKARVSARSGAPIRILSAGCAAGEEAYSLAITVADSGLFADSESVRISGVDLDPDALARAAEGVYGDNAFRRVDPAIRQKHFEVVSEGRWRIDGKLRLAVGFDRVNLAEDGGLRALPPQDVIFCRNVLIYFAEERVRDVIERFYRLLKPGGYLFLGHAETLSRVPTRFVPIRQHGALFYQKPVA